MESSNNTAMECFKIPNNILANLNIAYYYDNFKIVIVLWSKYGLYIIDPISKDTIDFNVQFEIEQVFVNNGCLLCLDCSGIMKLCTTEPSSICHKQNIKCVYACEIHNRQHVVSLQFERNRSKLLLNKFDMNFESQNEFELRILNEDWRDPERGKAIITAGHVKPQHLKNLADTFYIGNSDSSFLLVIISLDRKNVYAVLMPVIPIKNDTENISNNNSLNSWVQLYSTFSEIVDIKIIMMDEICVILGLAAGNIIKIPLLRNKKSEVGHLNTAINKFTVIDDNIIIYSDGLTMWRNENLMSQSECEFKQFVVRNVRDFCLIKTQLYCVTYANLLYSFDIGYSRAYLDPPSTYVCNVELVTNSVCLEMTMDTIDKNKQLLEKINKETEYLLAVSLSNRQDIMDELIQVNVCVFDDFRDLTKTYTDLTLTDELNAYYDSESYYFLVQISVAKIQHKLCRILSGVLDDIKLHIILFEQELLKTTTIQLKEQLSKMNVVVSLKKENRNIRRVTMYIKIVTNVPGKYKENERLWIILYRKKIVLHSENFINMKPNTSNIVLKGYDMPMQMLICKITNQLHGTHYTHDLTSKHNFEWTFYVKLPSDCKLDMANILELVDNLDSKRTEVFHKYITKFSKDKNWLELDIGKERANLIIEDDKLKVTCQDLIIASDIRNFFSSIIFTAFKDKPALFNYNLTYTIENWKKDIESKKKRKSAEFARLLIEFLKDIYCTIPI